MGTNGNFPKSPDLATLCKSAAWGIVVVYVERCLWLPELLNYWIKLMTRITKHLLNKYIIYRLILSSRGVFDAFGASTSWKQSLLKAVLVLFITSYLKVESRYVCIIYSTRRRVNKIFLYYILTKLFNYLIELNVDLIFSCRIFFLRIKNR